ncbi:alpha/beta hydrolase [Streptomyces lincolnensis]|nr:alpha/beta hydrolase [Streptomyces lincolnensis]
MPIPPTNMARFAPATAGCRTARTSTRGVVPRSSMTAQTQSSATATTARPAATARCRLHRFRSPARNSTRSLPAVHQPLAEAAWRTVPSTYVLCEDDVAIPLSLQEEMAKHAQRVRRLRSSHSPFLSRPAELARLLRDAIARS